MKEITKKYSNGEVIVIWKPHVCLHSGKCYNGLPSVFNINVRPWVKPEGADTEKIISQIMKCPSGALSFEMNNDASEEKSR